MFVRRAQPSKLLILGEYLEHAGGRVLGLLSRLTCVQLLPQAPAHMPLPRAAKKAKKAIFLFILYIIVITAARLVVWAVPEN